MARNYENQDSKSESVENFSVILKAYYDDVTGITVDLVKFAVSVLYLWIRILPHRVAKPRNPRRF